MVHDLAFPVLIGAQQHLRVGIAREAVTQPAQLVAQLAEVVDLAVEGQREARGGIAHRLTRPFGIDDREPAVTEKYTVSRAGAAEGAHALVVRPAMSDGLKHRRGRALP